MDEEEKVADISMPVIIQTESPRHFNKVGGGAEETNEVVKINNPVVVGSQIVNGAGGLQTGTLKPIQIMTDSLSQQSSSEGFDPRLLRESNLSSRPENTSYLMIQDDNS